MARATSRGSSSRSTSGAKKKAAGAKKKAASKSTAKKAPAKSAAKKASAKAAAKKAAPKRAPKAKAPAKKPAKKAAPKKVTAKKAAPREPKAPAPKPKKKVKPALDARAIRKMRDLLRVQREQLTKEFQHLEQESLTSQSEASGEVSYDEDYADAGSFTFEREKELSIGQNVRDLLDKVESALKAIDDKTYGICSNCGKAIAKARMQALPYSTLCLECKQQQERHR